ncbi:MAG TPA: Ig-like domain-containing protein, partial [Longimicrobium sp.]|nr:Ig-like domain-containing protein [Longimicrobium sp.]
MSSHLASTAARRFAGILLSAAALAACSDRGDPLATPAPEGPAAQVARLRCVASVKERTVTCGAPSGVSGDARALIVGGQGQYVQLTSGEPSYEAADSTFTFTLAIQNLIPQPMATDDGTTPDSAGVRIFFVQPPTATVGSGALSIANADGVDAFTAGGQAYYRYAGALLGGDGILSPNETSGDRTWIFDVEPTVEAFEFLLLVSAEVPFDDGFVDVTPAADTMTVGAATQLTATVRSAVGEEIEGQPVAWESSDTTVAVVGDSGLVMGVGAGTATITATSGARAGTATVAVCPALAVGGVAVFDMPAGASLCLAGAAEYTLVPANVSEAAGISLGITGAGIVPVSGPPTPDRIAVPGLARTGRAARPRPDYAFEARLRRMERRVAGTAARGGVSALPGPRRAITPGVPAVGALMSINVETDDACSTADVRTGRVVTVGTHVIVLEDTMNPAGGLTAAQYQLVADQFDSLVFPAVTGAFGTPNDIDGNGRVIAFYTRAVNELTPPGASSLVGGFFFSRDLRPAAGCPTSNVGELFYMMAADSTGEVNGNARSVSFVLENTLGTLAHELEHLINASRRLGQGQGTPLEETWLDEGMAHVAEELVFYGAAGLAPRSNLDVADIGGSPAVQDAFFRYADANFGRLRQWLLAPHDDGAFQDDDDLATRGAAWAFLRYAADRRGGSEAAFWNALAGSTTTGMANLQAALGADPLPFHRDFAAAMYADDAAGLAQTPIHTQPSWDFRALYSALDYAPGPACSCAYELAVRDPANGVTDTFTLSEGGGAAYVRMGV